MPEVKRYEGGKLTSDGWKLVHAEGHSVLHNGQLYPPGSKIPSDAALAAGNPVREEAARTAIQAQMADLQNQLNSLGKNRDMVEPVGNSAALIAHEDDEPHVPGDLMGSVPPRSGPDAVAPDDGKTRSRKNKAANAALGAEPEPGEPEQAEIEGLQ